jgi:deoxyribodipyrimidine photo-lyase
VTAIWWVRRDARLHDNPALREAQEDGDAIAVFPWSPPLARWSGRRVAHLARALWSLRDDAGDALTVRRGTPADVLVATALEAGATAVWAQREYSPSAVAEQDAVERALADAGVTLRFTGSPYAVAPGRVVKGDGTPYQVFTPFSRAWRDHGWRAPAPAADPTRMRALDSDVSLDHYAAHGDAEDPLASRVEFRESRWLERLADFVDGRLDDYAEGRDLPGKEATSRLSVPLAFGQIHPRTILAATAGSAGRSARVFESELAWREFHADVLHHHPRALRESLRQVVPDDAWESGRAADEAFIAWREGRTGFPLVDAGMRELKATGTMHNRVRMVVASFLVKDLHVPWQRGADYFRRALLDYDHAQNQLNWQWVAGTGRDASPYFRVFNPDGQRDRFDPDLAYVRRWVAELDTPAYPARIVDHKAERERALADHSLQRALSRASDG